MDGRTPLLRGFALAVVLLFVGTVPWMVGGSDGNDEAVGQQSTPALASEAPLGGASAVEILRGMPLVFTPNLGQAPDEVRFQARGPGYVLHLTDDEVVLVGQTSDADVGAVEDVAAEDGAAAPLGPPHVVRFAFPDALRPTAVTGEERQPGVVNHYIGNDPDKWVEGAPTFAKVRYEGLYPGVDLVFYATDANELEFDFEVAPGADPDAVAIAMDGAPTRLDDDGRVLIEGEDATFVMDAPVVYQEGRAGREPVESSFVLDDGTVRFDVGAYDASRTLVIDPVITYGAYLGDGGDDRGWGVAVGPAGNVYVTGWTQSSSFPTTPDAHDASWSGRDAFVTKLSPDGSTILYSTFLGGNRYDEARSIDVTSDGNAYITGHSESSNYPTKNAYRSTHPYYSTTWRCNAPGGYCAKPVLTRLDADGQLAYSTYFGGTSYPDDYAYGIDARDDGHVAIVGRADTRNSYFPSTWTSYEYNYCCSSSYQQAWIGVFDTEAAGGSSRLYATAMGPRYEPDRFIDVAWMPNGNVAAVGHTQSRSSSNQVLYEWYTTSNAYKKNAPFDSSGSVWDPMVVVFDPSSPGNSPVYSSFLPGSGGSDFATGVVADDDGLLHIVGGSESNNQPTTADSMQQSRGGSRDAVYWILDTTKGSSGMEYVTYLGGTGFEYAQGIALHPTQGGAVISGYTKANGLPTTPDAYQGAYGGGANDMFFSWIDPTKSGSDGLGYSTYIGGPGDDVGRGVAVNSAGQAWMVGRSSAAGMPTSGGTITGYDGGGSYDGSDPKGNHDAFLVGLPFNRPPVAVDDDDMETYEHWPYALFDVTANDSDVDHDPPGQLDPPTVGAVDAVSAQDYATMSIDASGMVNYTLDLSHPDIRDLGEGEHFMDSFTYTLSDSQGETDTATVDVKIHGVDQPMAQTAQAYAPIESNTDPGGSDPTAITTLHLDAQKPGIDPPEAGDAVFVVTDLPNGTLWIDGAPAAVGDTFQRADLLAGLVGYVSWANATDPVSIGGSPATDSFWYKLYEEADDGKRMYDEAVNDGAAADGTPQEFPIQIIPWDDPPTAAFTVTPGSATQYATLPFSFTDASLFGDEPLSAWHWDFGDDMQRSGALVGHAYGAVAEPTEYTVTMTVTENDKQDVAQRAVTVLPYTPSKASFLLSADKVYVGDPVSFTDTSFEGTVPLVGREWDFRDAVNPGESTSAPETVHRFTRTGMFRITLTVTDELGYRFSAMEVVQVIEPDERSSGSGGDSAASADAAAQAGSGGADGDDAAGEDPDGYVAPDLIADAGPDQTAVPGTVVRLEGAAVGLPPEVVSFHWTQSLGMPVELEGAEGPSPMLAVPWIAPGSEAELRFQLVVGDGTRESEPDEMRVLVTPGGVPSQDPVPPPDAGFVAEVDEGGFVRFEALEPEGANYTWDLGDGNVIQGGAVLEHVYERGGVYEVRLTVQDAFGRTTSGTDTVPLANDPSSLQRQDIQAESSTLSPWWGIGALLLAAVVWGAFLLVLRNRRRQG